MPACNACKAKSEVIAAKDQTILVMADMIDDLRRQLAGDIKVPGFTRSGLPDPHFAPIEDPMDKLYASDLEEEIQAAANAGYYGTGPVGTEAAQAALQTVGAMNTHITLVP
jgi:hypothetical protein